MVSVWNVMQVPKHLMRDDDLNQCEGSNCKMSLNYSDNLMQYPNVIDIFADITQGIEIEFDPAEPQVFFFSTSEGLFKVDKRETVPVPVKLDTVGLNSPTSMSMSDKGFLLAGFSCGSIW